VDLPADDRPAGRSLWSDATRRLLRERTTKICLAVIALYVLIAIAGAVYEALADRSDTDELPTWQQMKDYSRRNEPPRLDDPRYWMGTDWAGRPVLLKTLLAAKISLSVGLIANVIAVPLGMILGAIAGYYGGKIDTLIVWLFSTLASIPGIILLIALKFAFAGIRLGPIDLSGIQGVYVALAVVSWIGTCRLVRAETMKLRELDYVLAARAAGRRSLAILFSHILPNVFHIGIIQFSLGFVYAIKSEVMLSYLNLGVESGQPSWGTMINEARMQLFAGRWWELTAAVTAMFFLVLALSIFGDRLRDALDPRLKNV